MPSSFHFSLGWYFVGSRGEHMGFSRLHAQTQTVEFRDTRSDQRSDPILDARDKIVSGSGISSCSLNLIQFGPTSLRLVT
jgi:hypothetical protein